MKTNLLLLYLIAFIACDSDDQYEEDKKKCADVGADKQKCLNLNSTTSEHFCCFSYLKNETESESGQCQMFEAKTYYKYSTTRANTIEREIEGFECYSSLYNGAGESSCENKKKSLLNLISECTNEVPIEESGIYSFEESEKSILKNENHCLTYKYKMHPNLTEPTEKNCAEATMTQKARDEGIICGFYELVFTFENTDEKKTIKTCYLLDPELIKNEQRGKIYLENLASQLIDRSFKEFQVSISDVSGISFSYDSKEGKFIDNSTHNDNNNNNNNNDSSNITNGNDTTTEDNSKLISYSKFMLLLILISL